MRPPLRNLQCPDARQRIEGLRTDAFDVIIAKITAGSERAEIRFGSTEREEFRVVSPKGPPLRRRSTTSAEKAREETYRYMMML